MNKQIDQESVKTGRFFVRPLVGQDLHYLMCSVGPVVDTLYPQGGMKLLARLENASVNYCNAYVVAHDDAPHLPLALASECEKGVLRRKVSTLWGMHQWRRCGVGSLLMFSRVQAWLNCGVESVHITVRASESRQITLFLNNFGFRQIALAVARYNGADELVLQWRPEWYLATA